jgi:AcrR family transcriptional regulator
VTGRTRGRPRGGVPTDTREQILIAARTAFAEKGFDGASLRAIASAAGVDASLIRHYFGDKAGLLVATLQLPVNPLELIMPMLAEGPDGLGARILTMFLTTWDAHREVFSGLIRTAVATADRGAPAMSLVRGVLLPSLAQAIGGQNAQLRASLVMSQVFGMATVRYVLKIEPLASASVEDVVALYAPGMQSVITPAASA